MHCVVHELRGRVRSGADCHDFLTLIDLVEEHLWCVQLIEIYGEEDVVVPNDVRRWLALRISSCTRMS